MQHIVIVMESCLLRNGIVNILTSKFPDLIVSTYGPYELQEMIKKENMGDLLIIDIDIGIDYLKVIERYEEQHKKVIIWTSTLEDNCLLALFQRGLNGYFYDRMDTREFVSATYAVLKGDYYVHSAFSSILFPEYVRRSSPATKPTDLLTKKEWEVLELMTNGYRNKRIAESLQISERTVQRHAYSIYKKLNVSDRTSAVLVALKQRWFVL